MRKKTEVNFINNNSFKFFFAAILILLGGFIAQNSLAAGISSIAVTAPNGNEYISGTTTVTWSSTGTDDVIYVFYATNTAAAVTTSTVTGLIGTTTSATGTYTKSWNTAALTGRSDYLIKVIAQGNNASDTSNATFTVDNLAPAIVFTDNVAAGPATSETIIITVTEANATTGTYAYGFTTGTCNASSTYGNTFTSGVGFVINTETNNGNYICAKASDLASNTTYSSSTNPLNIDVTAPTLSTTTIASSNSSSSYAKVGDTITLTIVASEDIATPTITIATHSATSTKGADVKNWTGTYTMVTGDASGTIAFTINFSDLLDNAGTQVTTTTDSSSVTFDKTVPVITFTDDVSGPVTSDTIIITVADTNPRTSAYEYGFNASNDCNATSTYGNSFTSGSSFVITSGSHNSYYICAKASDNAGNITYKASGSYLQVIPPNIGGSGGGGFVATDVIAPIISQIKVVAGDTFATISWSTNENSISWVYYGVSSAYGSELKTAVLTATHSLKITNLSPSTVYHYQVKSKDSLGNTGSYNDNVFTTLAAGATNTVTYNQTTVSGSLASEILRITNLIAQLRAQLSAMSANPATIPVGFTFKNTLSFGMVSDEVKYLQIILNSNADTIIVNSGLGSSGQETTKFGVLTRSAVIRFQEKYASEILTPLGLTKGTGLVGSATCAKLNKTLGK
jgi:hypothetical protein